MSIEVQLLIALAVGCVAWAIIEMVQIYREGQKEKPDDD